MQSMDTPICEYFDHPSKCRTASLNRKIQLIRELSKYREKAQDKLSSWTRKDIFDILCQDVVKDRKFTGLSKQRMLEYLFKVTSSGTIRNTGTNGTTDNKMKLLEEPESHSQENDDDEEEEEEEEEEEMDCPVIELSPAKRQRKSDAPIRLLLDRPVLPLPTNSTSSTGTGNIDMKVCVNVACRNRYNGTDPYCKRCSCCICFNFDENKDPSLWLFCSSDPPYQGFSCGRSCHIECAFKNEKSGIGTGTGIGTKLDGSYYCPYCGKENDLLGCLKKQLTIGKEARRVDVLCYRIYLSHKLIKSSEKYNELREIVEIAKKKLEKDVGPITGSTNMGRGIVNRLQFGAEVQKLCAKGVELVEKSLVFSSSCSIVLETKILELNSNLVLSKFIRFPIVASTCLTIVLKLEEITPMPLDLSGFHLWHRKSDASEYAPVPTGTIFLPNRSIVVTELVPSTRYQFKLVAFNHSKIELNSWEVNETTTGFSEEDSKRIEIRKQPSFDFSNPNSSNPNSSEGGESNNSATVYADLNKSPERETDSDSFEDCENHEISLNGSGSDQLLTGSGSEELNRVSGSGLDEEPVPNTVLIPQTGLQKDSPDPRSENESNTPNGTENIENGNGAIIRLVSTRPVTPIRTDNDNNNHHLLKSDNSDEERGSYEYCVKVVRRLECEGLIESNFRVKFLTWFSLRATAQERKIVSVYVDTLVDDPVSLAGQLSDTFSERVFSKRPPQVPNGFCTNLWH